MSPEGGKTPSKDKKSKSHNGHEVQLYDPQKTDVTSKFTTKLKKYLNKHKLKRRLSKQLYTVTVVVEPGNINKNSPLLVICNNHSRIETDIDHTISELKAGDRDLPASERICIVVLHVTEKHALPVLLPTDSLSGEYRDKFGRIVDFFYSNDHGWYKCPLRKQAKAKLKDFVKETTGQTKKLKKKNDQTTE